MESDTQNYNTPEKTEIWDPVPEVVIPGEENMPPSDAVILFDGKSLGNWIGEDGKEPRWKVQNDEVTIVPGSGSIHTRESFGSCQLHIEWKIPMEITGNGQGRGNSGVFMMGKYEIQILDSYNNRTYSNGQAGAVYKQHIPLVNACKPPGIWQSFDILFSAPAFNEKGKLIHPARVTVLHNGVLIQNDVALKGPTLYIGEPEYDKHPKKLPLMLQDHKNEVSFRNIWIRNL